MKPVALFMVGVVGVGAAAGCVEKRFDVDLQVTRAASVAGGIPQYNYSTDVDGLDPAVASGKSRAEGLVVSFAASTIQFEVDAAGGDGFGRSGAIAIPDEVETLAVPVLLAKESSPGLVSSTPQDLGGDACVAVDENGVVFMMGGSASTHSGSVFDGTFTVRNFGSSAPIGAANPGCAAHGGKVAVVVDNNTVFVTDTAGNEVVVNINGLDTFVGAVAAPRRDGSLWLIDGDNDIFFVGVDGRVALVATAVGLQRRGIEVTGNDSLVTIIDEQLVYVDDSGPRLLGNARALGRRLGQVFVLDGETLSVIANAATDVVGTVSIGAVDSFVVLSDDRVVGLTTAGALVGDDVDGFDAGRRHTRLVGLPGDTVLMVGADGAGFDGFSRR